jgi:hypothetical protein
MALRALLFGFAFVLAAQPPQEQRPKFQPNWPCTGKEPSYDPTYAKAAEATGGQLFLFDRSEAGKTAAFLIGQSSHQQTVFRSVGTIDKGYLDFQVPIDPSIESLFISASVQCMERVILYDAQVKELEPETIHGQNQWYRAGRVATIPQPPPGIWIIRLMGAGPYSISVKAKTPLGMHNLKFADNLPKFGIDQQVDVWLKAPTPSLQFRLVDGKGDTLQPVVLSEATIGEGHWTGSIIPSFKQFRVAASGTDDRGFAFQRVDPRLFEAK